MTGLFRGIPLQKNGSGILIDICGEAPDKAAIELARSSFVQISTVITVGLLIVAAIGWFLVPPLIGFGIMYAAFSLAGVVYTSAFRQVVEARWLPYVPVGMAIFTFWLISGAEDEYHTLAVILVVVLAVSVLNAVPAIYSYLQPEHDDELLSMIHELSQQHREISNYLQSVAASGRRWLIKAEILSLASFADWAEAYEPDDRYGERVDYAEKLFGPDMQHQQRAGE